MRFTQMYGDSITALVEQLNDSGILIERVIYMGLDTRTGKVFTAVIDNTIAPVVVTEVLDDTPIEFTAECYMDIRSA